MEKLFNNRRKPEREGKKDCSLESYEDVIEDGWIKILV